MLIGALSCESSLKAILLCLRRNHHAAVILCAQLLLAMQVEFLSQTRDQYPLESVFVIYFKCNRESFFDAVNG